VLVAHADLGAARTGSQRRDSSIAVEGLTVLIGVSSRSASPMSLSTRS
jgi:hypothetical protein